MKSDQFRPEISCVFSESDRAILELYAEGMPLDWIAQIVEESVRDVVRSLAFTIFEETGVLSDPSKRNYGKEWHRFEIDGLKKACILSIPPRQIAHRFGRDLFGVLFKIFELRLAIIPPKIALHLDSRRSDHWGTSDRLAQQCSNCLDVIAYCSRCHRFVPVPNLCPTLL